METKKNCKDSDFDEAVDSSQHYAEYLSGIRMEKKGDLSYTNNFEHESIDDYFTAIQFLSNALLLKRFKIRSKKSNCGYYKLYEEKILTLTQYTIIEQIRINRNLIHYNAYEANLISNTEINKLQVQVKECLTLLKKLYEEK